ncbi:MAG TPA: hypothetical protein VHL34_24700 [Rhizomicrobium sp.]|jgi:hypothetical protein|nr:hypothetical protein [Rhizomicrobium sp.]
MTQLAARPEDYERARRQARLLAFPHASDASVAEARMAEARTAKRIRSAFWGAVGLAVIVGALVVWGMR